MGWKKRFAAIGGTKPKWWSWLLLILIVTLTFAAYYPAVRGGFIWDDDKYVTENPLLTAPDGLRRIWTTLETPQYYPLVFTTFWIERQLWGLQPMGYHIVNVMLHIANALIVWLLLAHLRVRAAWLVAAIFALHPVHVESVAWITERKNVLSGMFYLLAMWSYLEFEENQNRRWYMGALGLFVMALFSKTVTSTLPVALILLRFLRKQRIDWQYLQRLAPFFILGLGFAMLTHTIEVLHVGAHGKYWDLTIWQRILLAGRAPWFYAFKLVLPVNLTFVYPRWQLDPLIFLQWVWPLGIAAAGLIFWRLRDRLGRGPIVGISYFIITLAPASGFFNVYPMRFSFVADHFQYLASLGIITLAVSGAAWGLERRGNLTAVQASVLALLSLLTVLTWRQGCMYRNSETLWRETLYKNPGASMAHNNMGQLLFTQGKLNESARHTWRALQIEPDNEEYHRNLGVILAHLGNMDEAMVHFREALRISPDFWRAHFSLGNALASLGELEEATKRYQKALKISPTSPEIHVNLGIALGRQGRPDEGIRHLREALRLHPTLRQAHVSLGIALAEQGKIDEAIEHYEQALRIDPDCVEAHVRLGTALTKKGMSEEAKKHFQRAEGINPALAKIYRSQK